MTVIDTQTGDALLDDILANPADDAVRLVYADWLEEYGGRSERAALIRDQIRGGGCVLTAGKFWDWFGSYPGGWLRAWPGSPGVAIHHGDTGGELICKVGYFSPPRRSGSDPYWTFTITRGFISHVRWTLEGWLRYGKELVQRYPIECVELLDVEPEHVQRVPGFGEQRFDCWRLPSIPLALLGRDSIWFATRQDALDALSIACLAWARS